MAKFTYTDDDTGMSVTAISDEPLQGDDIDWLFGESQRQSQKKLIDGSFALDDDGIKELKGESKRKSLRTHLARSMGVGEDKIDIDSGMGFWDRTKLNMQATDADKMKQLEDTYGKDGVAMLDVGGTPKMFYKDPKSNKMTMVDEQGTSFADFTADIAGEVLPTVGSVVGGVVGSAASPVLGTAAGSALGYGAVAGLQDAAVRALSGEDIRPGEIAGRTAVEMAVMAPFDQAPRS
jgi:hypothetical protein